MLWPKFIFILIYKITGIIQVFYIILIILFENFFLSIYLILYYFIFFEASNLLIQQTLYLQKFYFIFTSINKKWL